jgi:hypothetical protein
MMSSHMDGILNEVTNTVHKQEPGSSALVTSCGVTNNLSEDQLRHTAIEQLVTTTTTKCGRCFDDGGGY